MGTARPRPWAGSRRIHRLWKGRRARARRGGQVPHQRRAAGLLWSRTAPWAAAGLAVLLVAIFPANVQAALDDPTPAVGDGLVPRTAIQLVFLAATIAIPAHYVGTRKRESVETSAHGVVA